MAAPSTYHVSHSIWMIVFPLIALFLSVISLVVSFIFWGEDINFIFPLILNFLLFLCVLEPLNHSFSLFFFLGLFYFVSVGIVILPIWRCIKYYRDFCYVSKGRIVLKSGLCPVTKFDVPLKNVATVQCRMGVYGHFLDYGDLYFYMNDGTSYYFRYVSDAKDVCEVLNNFVQYAKSPKLPKEANNGK